MQHIHHKYIIDFYRKMVPHEIHERPWKAIIETDITTNKMGRCEPAKPASGQDPSSCEHGNGIRIA
jgi:hypothetical protein